MLFHHSTDRDAEMKRSLSHASPQVSTLRGQTADLIKQAILEERWVGHLPSEAELCRLLKVGRKTVRSALTALAAQNLIVPGGKGRNHQISAVPPAMKKASLKAKPTRIIRFLSNEAFHELGELTTMSFNAAADKLAKAGYELVFDREAGLYKRFNKARIEQITSRPNTAGWILFRTTRQTQEWFQEKQIPAIITGSAHQGVQIPSVRFDYQAACRHAVSLLLEKGHANIAYLAPRERIASEEESVQAFLSFKKERPDARFSLIEHNDLMSAITQGILASRLGREPVTAYLVLEPLVAVSALSILHASGIIVPDHASIIALSGAGMLIRVLPNITHYQFDGAAHGRALAKELLSNIGEGRALHRCEDIGIKFHKFIPGGSVGRA
jgi:DNA-binding LacI/PurR family transcriptional regulator